jgi:hypothetical protein
MRARKETYKKLEVGSWKLEDGRRKTEDGSWKLEVGRRLLGGAVDVLFMLRRPELISESYPASSATCALRLAHSNRLAPGNKLAARVSGLATQLSVAVILSEVEGSFSSEQTSNRFSLTAYTIAHPQGSHSTKIVAFFCLVFLFVACEASAFHGSAGLFQRAGTQFRMSEGFFPMESSSFAVSEELFQRSEEQFASSERLFQRLEEQCPVSEELFLEELSLCSRTIESCGFVPLAHNAIAHQQVIRDLLSVPVILSEVEGSLTSEQTSNRFSFTAYAIVFQQGALRLAHSNRLAPGIVLVACSSQLAASILTINYDNSLSRRAMSSKIISYLAWLKTVGARESIKIPIFQISKERWTVLPFWGDARRAEESGCGTFANILKQSFAYET